MQPVLPNCRKIRIRQFLRHSINQHVGGLGRLEILFLASFLQQLPFVNKLVKDSCSGCLSAYAIHRLQLFLCLRILHEFMNILHSRNQGSLGKAAWRLGNALPQLAGQILHAVIFLHGRQGIAIGTIVTILAVIIIFAILVIVIITAIGIIRAASIICIPGFFLIGIKSLPAQINLRPAAGSKQLILVGHLHLGLIVGVNRIKLRQICLGNQKINIPLHNAHLRQINPDTGGNNGVMRRNLLVVPGPAFYFAVRPCRPGSQLLMSQPLQILQDNCAILKLICRQVFTVGTWIGGQLLLVELLSRVQHLLRLIAKPPACQHLQGGQGKRQSLLLLLFRLGVAGNHAIMGALQKFCQLRLSNLFINQPAIRVKPHLNILWLPLGCKLPVGMLKKPLDSVIILRLEILYFPLPAHYKCQCRSLDTAYRQHQIAVAGTLSRQSIGTGQIHAYQPVCPCPRQCRLPEIEKLRILTQILNCFLNAFFIQSIKEYPPYRLVTAHILKHLVHQQLTFTVRVPGMNDFICLADKLLHHSKLLGTALRYQQLPLLRHDGQILRPPDFVFCIVFLWLRLPQHMAEKPCDRACRRFNKPIALPLRPRQVCRNLTPHAGLFRYK